MNLFKSHTAELGWEEQSMWLYQLPRAILAFAIQHFHLNQSLILWVCFCCFSPSFILAALQSLRRALRLLGKCPDHLQVGQALLHFSIYGGDLFSLPRMDLNLHSRTSQQDTGHWSPQLATVLQDHAAKCSRTILFWQAELPPSTCTISLIAIQEHFMPATIILHLNTSSDHALMLPMPVESKRAIHWSLSLVTSCYGAER